MGEEEKHQSEVLSTRVRVRAVKRMPNVEDTVANQRPEEKCKWHNNNNGASEYYTGT